MDEDSTMIVDSNDIEPEGGQDRWCSKFYKGGFEFHGKPRFIGFYYIKVVDDGKNLWQAH
jgi:hypothetical protein